jgi:hypothetical protein
LHVAGHVRPFQGAVKPVLGAAELSAVLMLPCQGLCILSLNDQQITGIGARPALAELLDKSELLTDDWHESMRSEQAVMVRDQVAEPAEVLDRPHIVGTSQQQRHRLAVWRCHEARIRIACA